MGLLSIKQANISFYGFASYSVQPYGRVKLLVTTGSHPIQATILTNLLIMDTLGVCNAIIGRLTLNNLRAVASMYHLALKFPTPPEVKVVYVNQVKARHYYALALKGQSSTY